MNRSTALLLCLITCAAPFQADGQADTNIIGQIEENEKRAWQYTRLAMYRSAVNEWTQAIDMAKVRGLTVQYLDASISLAELMRKTGDFERSLDILLDLPETKNYPRLHVRKLGRIAAVYHEMAPPPKVNTLDSVEHYITMALELASDFNFTAHEVSLKNELGYFVSRNGSIEKGLAILLEAAQLYKQLDDTLGYIGSMTHALEDYYTLKDLENIYLVKRELLSLIEGTQWHTAQIDIFDIIGNNAGDIGDSMNFYRWKRKAADAAALNERAISSQQMAAFRVLHDTRKYQEDAEASKVEAQVKAEELEKQQARTQELTIYLSILAIFILLVAGLFIREKRLKAKMDEINQALNAANEKYQMLMVESNHRIKNNLQMVISMLQYSSKEMDSTNTKALKRISSKIHTISALHKHLYLDVHNERVPINAYFNEIITLYEEIAPNEFTIKQAIEPVGIKSERIVYFGLIFNEMLSNTIEHRKQIHKSVNIEVVSTGDQFMFSYQDGANIPVDGTKGMGSQLIEQLIRRVGGKKPHFDPSKGLYQFTFNV